jgi:G patch domain-containing protein 1
MAARGEQHPSVLQIGQACLTLHPPLQVRDEKGRRRLHGAFTGGFSAGYFNTVGSKEGWAPSTFVSSRANKAAHQQRPEDFMDEEDLAELRQAESKKLAATEEYDPLLGNRLPKDAGAPEGIEGALKDLVEPNRERVGDKLLRKMGWREGQGVGPRISWKARKRQAAQLGIDLGPDEEGEDEQEREKHLWPPLDRKLVLFEQRLEREGVGYVRGKRLGDLAFNEKPKGAAPGPSKQMPIGGVHSWLYLSLYITDTLTFPSPPSSQVHSVSVLSKTPTRTTKMSL